MKIAFTICSNNYLAQARVLADSWYQHNPDIEFKIFLVDEFHPDIDYLAFGSAEVIGIKQVVGEYIHDMASRFDITGLNTALKADVALYLLKQNRWQKFIYLDPDILIKDNLNKAYAALEQCNALLTPHIMTPIDDQYGPNDVHLLPTGIFNLGFLGFSATPVTHKMLSWWRERVQKYCYRDDKAGLFYDQIWMNYAPIFYERIGIFKEPGYNMANWNLHERQLSYISADNIMVNNSQRLCFFHFSGFDYNKFPEKICSYHSRYSMASRPDIRPIFNEYFSLLKAAGFEKFAAIKCAFY